MTIVDHYRYHFISLLLGCITVWHHFSNLCFAHCYVLTNQTGIQCINSACPITMVCDRKTNYCECKDKYMVSVNPHMPCLLLKYLNEQCVHSDQCSHIEHAVCMSKKRQILLLLPFKKFFAHLEMVKHPEKFISSKEVGRCECRAGFWPNQNYRCEVKRLESVNCSDNHDCPDPNSHCNFVKRKCTCHFGHVYDSIQDRCLLNMNMFGVFCKTDLDCQVHDEEMRCWMGTCTCINNNRLDPFRGCEQTPCKKDQTWNEFTKSCEPIFKPIWTIVEDKNKTNVWKDWTQLSVKVAFRLFVFCLVLVGAFITLKNRKLNISALSTGSGLRRVYRDSPKNIRAQVSSNQNHSLNLQINLAGIERDTLMAPQINLEAYSRRASGSSLPPYECAVIQSMENQLEMVTLGSPPSYEQLPTYEEATNGLVQTTNHSGAKSQCNQ